MLELRSGGAKLVAGVGSTNNNVNKDRTADDLAGEDNTGDDLIYNDMARIVK